MLRSAKFDSTSDQTFNFISYNLLSNSILFIGRRFFNCQLLNAIIKYENNEIEIGLRIKIGFLSENSFDKQNKKIIFSKSIAIRNHFHH